MKYENVQKTALRHMLITKIREDGTGNEMLYGLILCTIWTLKQMQDECSLS